MHSKARDGHLDDVLKFYRKHNFPVADLGDKPDPNFASLWVRLLGEELGETLASLGKFSEQKGLVLAFIDAVISAASKKAADGSAPLPELVDGLHDTEWVLKQGHLMIGNTQPEPQWQEVCRANMDKLPGNVRGDGKIMKPTGWRPPDIAGLVEAEIGKRESSDGYYSATRASGVVTDRGGLSDGG